MNRHLFRGPMKRKTESLLTWKTDDPDTTATVPEPPPVVQPVPPSPLPQHRIHGKREAAVAKEASDLASSCLKRMSCLCTVSCRVSESKFRNMSAITELYGLELTLSLRILWVKISKQESKNDSHQHRVSDNQGVELTFDVSRNDLEKFQAKPNSSRNLIASTIRKSAEVTLSDQKGRKEFEVAKYAEIQS